MPLAPMLVGEPVNILMLIANQKPWVVHRHMWRLHPSLSQAVYSMTSITNARTPSSLEINLSRVRRMSTELFKYDFDKQLIHNMASDL